MKLYLINTCKLLLYFFSFCVKKWCNPVGWKLHIDAMWQLQKKSLLCLKFWPQLRIIIIFYKRLIKDHWLYSQWVHRQFWSLFAQLLPILCHFSVLSMTQATQLSLPVLLFQSPSTKLAQCTAQWYTVLWKVYEWMVRQYKELLTYDANNLDYQKKSCALIHIRNYILRQPVR